jgi:hypothetical protein
MQDGMFGVSRGSEPTCRVVTAPLPAGDIARAVKEAGLATFEKSVEATIPAGSRIRRKVDDCWSHATR